MAAPDDRFERWIASLEARHLADLTFPEVARALRALSSAYIERRHTLRSGGALDGAGKRAAFALFYGPLHFLLVQHVVRHLPEPARRVKTLVDIGCGTGASSAAWAVACDRRPIVVGVDRSAWALDEAAATYRAFDVDARLRRGDLTETVGAPQRSGPVGWLAAFTINELTDESRDAILPRIVSAADRGHAVLIVEPIGRIAGRWWGRWRDEFERAGGRADEWRFPVERPAIVAKLDRAAGLDHREITGRSLWIHRSGRVSQREPAGDRRYRVL
jgi:SAM-dependent methyltransferase